MTTKRRRLSLLPELLPKPQVVEPGFSSVRNRTIARLKVLAALGAAGVAASCGDTAYGVVDPLPHPSCFDSGRPTGTAKYVVDADAGADASAGDGSKLVEVYLVFKQAGIAVGSFSSSTGATLVSSTSPSSSTAKVVLRVPAGMSTCSAQLQISCSAGPTSLRFTLMLTTNSVEITDLGN